VCHNKHQIFYGMMNETTKFTSHMCHEPWPFSVGETTFCCSASLQWLSMLSKCNTQYKLSDLMIIWSRKHGTFFLPRPPVKCTPAAWIDKYFAKRIYVAPIIWQKQGAFYIWGLKSTWIDSSVGSWLASCTWNLSLVAIRWRKHILSHMSLFVFRATMM
jgi:hypothetical protein